MNLSENLLKNDSNLSYMAFGTGVINRFYTNKSLYYKDRFLDILRTIKNGKMPRRLKNDLCIRKTLTMAINSGYRIFDTGRLYGHSEKYIGEVLADYNRDDFYLISKISNDDLKRYTNIFTVHDNLSLTLKNLRTSYINTYLLHFPTGERLNMYKDMEDEFNLGRTKSIGVCNFDIEELKELLGVCRIKPAICQIELHPLNTKKELRKFCKENGIIVMAHTPTGHMDKRIIHSEIFEYLMAKYNKSAAQIIYRWHYQNGVIPIVSTISENHMKENRDILNFSLNLEEMEKIENLNQDFSFDLYNNKKSDCPNFIYNI